MLEKFKGFFLLDSPLSSFLPAEKGGLRTVDVSQSVSLKVCCSFDFPLNFTIAMGSFTQKHVLIQTGQSGSRKGMYGPIQTDQSENREGTYVLAQADQSEFLIISPCMGIKDESHLLICQSE